MDISEMSINERADLAANLKKAGRCNCCQAVVSVLADNTNLSHEQLMQLASGFAVGMGNTEATCGSLIGAVMVAGAKLEGNGTVRYARQISESFKARCGAITCKTLKGLTDEGIFCPCEECVRNAVLAYGDIINIVK